MFNPFFFILSGILLSSSAFADTDVFETIKYGSSKDVYDLIQKTDISALEDVQGNNALMLVSKYNKDTTSVKYVLNTHMDILKRNIDGDNALLLSLENPDIRNFKRLIRIYTTNGKLTGGEELLRKAIAKKSDLEHFQEIIAAKVNVNAKDDEGRTPLMLALSGNSDISIIKFLLANKADVNLLDNHKRNALMYAAFSTSDREIIKLLLSSSADITGVDIDGKTALSYALHNTNLAVPTQLQKAGLARNEKDYDFIKNNRAARLNFIKTADDEELTKLLKMKADFKIKDKESRTSLMYAARYNPRTSVISTLIGEGINLNEVDDNGFTALDYASKNPNAKAVKNELVKNGAFVVENTVATDENSQKKLFEAAKTGTDIQITVAISEKASVNAKDTYGKTALMIASEYNQNPSVIDTLARNGASVELKDNAGYTAIMLAARSNPNPEIIKSLLKWNANASDKYKNDVTLLMLASKDNPSKEVISLLLSSGADVNETTLSGDTALSYAALKPNLEAVKTLFAAGASIRYLSDDKINELLHLAVNRSDKELLAMMLTAGIKPERPIDEVKTLFMYAAENSDFEILETLIKNRADVNFAFKGSYPLFSALEASNISAVEVLIKHKANKNVLNQNHETPFAVSVRNKLPLYISESLWTGNRDEATKVLQANIADIDKDRLAFLISKGADLKSKDSSNNTMLSKALATNPDAEITKVLQKQGLKSNVDTLFAAVKNPNIDIMLDLLEKTHNPNMKDSHGNTPLMIAAAQGKIDFVKALLSAGANVRGRNDEGKNALHLAAENAQTPPELLTLLADEGINVNLTDYDRNTPLSLAVKAGADYDNFMALISKGAKIKGTFEDGNTLLILAARYNQDIRIVKYLISSGISLNSHNKERKSALYYAGNNKNPDIKALLIKNGAKQ